MNPELQVFTCGICSASFLVGIDGRDVRQKGNGIGNNCVAIGADEVYNSTILPTRIEHCGRLWRVSNMSDSQMSKVTLQTGVK